MNQSMNPVWPFYTYHPWLFPVLALETFYFPFDCFFTGRTFLTYLHRLNYVPFIYYQSTLNFHHIFYHFWGGSVFNTYLLHNPSLLYIWCSVLYSNWQIGTCTGKIQKGDWPGNRFKLKRAKEEMDTG